MCNSNSFLKGDVVCVEYKSYSHFYKEYTLMSRTAIVQSESEKYLFIDCIMECDSDYVFVNNNNNENKVALRKEEKPVELYAWLLNKYAKKGWKIFDPCLGSGSSRIACDKLGFDFVGCEINKEFYDLQEKRWECYKSQLKLF